LFEAHRHGGALFEVGLGIRTTVQYNLFGGSVANLGSAEQIEWLQGNERQKNNKKIKFQFFFCVIILIYKGVFDRQEIGCFALTERRAGVLSGLICDTTATVTEQNDIILNSGSEGNAKILVVELKIFSAKERIFFFFFFLI
jgi:hypothetical protein